MPKKKNKRLQSTEKGTTSDSALQSLPLPNNIILSKYYQHISQLPLHKFIDVVVDDNLYALVISGEPTKEELQEAWRLISLQYIDAIKDHETRMFFTLERDLHIQRATYGQILTLIGVLEKVYAKPFARMLNQLQQTNFKFDVNKPDEYDKELARSFNRSKGVKLAIDRMQIAFDKMRESIEAKAEGKKPTRESYYGILITLSDDAGYEIHENITVYAFCERIRRCNRRNDLIKTRQQHGKRK